MSTIEGKVVAITGASSGIGEAAARLLAERGAKVVVGARRSERLEKLVAAIQAKKGEARFRTLDVTSREDMKAFMDFSKAEFGRVDVLVNNAGIMPLSPMTALKVDEWDRMIDVNIRGVLNGIAAVLPDMKARGSGHIVNVASIGAHVVVPTGAVYSATKSAVRVISEGLRAEMAPHNIRVTILSPGAVKTELLEHISEADVQKANQDYVGQVGVPAETLARLVAFAISEPEDVGINEILFRPTAQEL